MKHFLSTAKQSWLIALAVLIGCGLANGQTTSVKTKDEISSSSATLIEATQDYQTSTKELLRLQESEVSKAAAKLEELRLLVAEGLVARAELENGEQSLAAL